METKLTKSQEKKLLNRVINKDFLNKNTRIKKIFAREGLKKYSDLMNSYNGYSERSLSSYQGLGSGTHRLIIKHLFEKGLIAKLPYYVVEPELNKTQKYHIRILEKMLSKAKDCPTKTNLGTIKLEGQNKELSIGRKYYYIDNKPYSAERESLLKICEDNPDKIEPIAESFAGAISIYKANKECKRLKTYFLNGIN
jgi:hypothetical protein